MHVWNLHHSVDFSMKQQIIQTIPPPDGEALQKFNTDVLLFTPAARMCTLETAPSSNLPGK